MMTKMLENPKRGTNKSGSITIAAEQMEATSNSEFIIFNPVAELSDSSLCFFIIYRLLSPGKYTPVYKSEIKRPERG